MKFRVRLPARLISLSVEGGIVIAVVMGFVSGCGNGAGSIATSPARRPLPSVVARGQALFYHSRPIAANNLSCVDCHLEGGRDEEAFPLIGVSAQYPKRLSRPPIVETLDQRIEQCIVRSLNGQRLSEDNPELTDLDAYVTWLSLGDPIAPRLSAAPVARARTFGGPPVRRARWGQTMYRRTCASCHGINGQGSLDGEVPPLWGQQSFGPMAGMTHIPYLAAFIKNNMPVSPQDGIRAGQLTPREAVGLAQFILSHARGQ